MIQSFFNGKTLNNSINPDEAVAYGAAVQACILAGNDTSGVTKDLLLLDVTPLSMGIETAGRVMSTLIPRNSTIPIKKQQIFSTYSDNQTEVSIQIFEGEFKMTDKNNHLGQFNLSGIPPQPRGIPQIEVTFDIDANGIVSVSAVDLNSKKQHQIVVNNDSSKRLSKQEIENEIRRKEDEEQFNQVQANNALEAKAYGLKSYVDNEENKKALSDAEKVQFDALKAKIDEVLRLHVNATALSTAECEAHSKQLDDMSRGVVEAISRATGGMPGGMGGMPGGMGGMPGGMGGMPGGMGGAEGGSSGPKIEEVD